MRFPPGNCRMPLVRYSQLTSHCTQEGYTETCIREVEYQVGILPWGATEAHNLHLPYGTDTIQAEARAMHDTPAYNAWMEPSEEDERTSASQSSTQRLKVGATVNVIGNMAATRYRFVLRR